MGVIEVQACPLVCKIHKIRWRRILWRIGFHLKKIWARLRGAGVPRHKNRPLLQRPAIAMRWSNFWFALRGCLYPALLMRDIPCVQRVVLIDFCAHEIGICSQAASSPQKRGPLLRPPSYNPRPLWNQYPASVQEPRPDIQRRKGSQAVWTVFGPSCLNFCKPVKRMPNKRLSRLVRDHGSKNSALSGISNGVSSAFQ